MQKVTVLLFWQPMGPVPVSVYVWVMGAAVVFVSVIVGLLTTVLLRPVEGLQLYVLPETAAAPMVSRVPEQVEGVGIPTLAAGRGATTTVTCLMLAQLLVMRPLVIV
jgi:hypothetical protein